MNMIKIQKKRIRILILSLLIVLLIGMIGFVSAASTDKTLEDFLKDKKNGIIDFMKLSPEDQQKIWEESLKKEPGYSYSRDALAEKIAQEIVIQKLTKVNDLFKGGGEIGAAIEKVLGTSLGIGFLEEMKKQGIPSLDIGLASIDLEKLKTLIQKHSGVDLRSEIEKVTGFGSSDLKWSGYIVGNGKVWINLENLPKGVKGLEYDGEKGVFILNFSTGQQIALGAGATDKNGNLTFISKLSSSDSLLRKALQQNQIDSLFQRSTASGIEGPTVEKILKQIAQNKDKKEIAGPFGIADFNFLGGTGRITIGENGFSITGNDKDGTRIRLGDFYFGRKGGEKSESVVSFYDDRLLLRGTEFTRNDYVKVGSTTENFIVNFGELPTRQISFIDYKEMSVWEGNDFSVHETKKASAVGRVQFIFDETGKVTHVSKEGINSGELISVSGKLDEGVLGEIYGKSGTQVQGLIKKANLGEIVNYNTIDKVFYEKNSYLRRENNDLKVDSLQNDFLNINGENFNIGGNGRIEVLKNLNSLTGYDTESFNVKIGTSSLKFKDGQILYLSAPTKGLFKINDISVINEGRTSGETFVLTGNSAGEQIFGKSREFTAGRSTNLGPMGSSTDLSMYIPLDQLESLRTRVGEGTRDDLTKELMKTPFEFEIAAFVPVGGAFSISPSRITDSDRQKILDFIKAQIDKEIVSLDMPASISQNTLDGIQGIISDFSQNLKIAGGELRLRFKNNPGSTPSIFYFNPDGSFKEVQLGSDAKNPTSTAVIVQDFLNVLAHTPAARMPVTEYDPGIIGSLSALWYGNGIPNFIGPGKYAEKLWINYFGRTENQLGYDYLFWKDLLERTFGKK
ncbi:hypothetical protein J4218_04670 [Candidatus Pacearchaeota archaeon]|nr:hypothetical protein [Candidatus Pacearchaeota archaeon]